MGTGKQLLVPAECKVYTPLSLAEAMVGAVCGGNPQTWLEPSVGQGAFIEVLHRQGVDQHQIIGIDLDRSSSRNDRLATVLRGVEFIKWSEHSPDLYDRVVGNPPFIPIRRLREPLRGRASQVRDHAGASVGVSSNLWHAFLLRAVALLAPGGHLAFILPAACEYAEYCRPGRNAITACFGRVDLIRSRRPLFEGVQEGSVVLVCRNKGGLGGDFRRHRVNDLAGVIGRLRNLHKYEARSCPPTVERGKDGWICLKDVMHVRLGGVTGDAPYFVMNESRRKELALPTDAVRPVVSRARHVRAAYLNERSWQCLRNNGERVWLFDPPNSVVSHASVQRYLKLKAAEGGCHRDRFKVRVRDPWYRTPMPKRPHGFISGMSGSGTWICMNEHSRLNATNTLYVIRFVKKEDWEQRYAWALALLASDTYRQVRRLRRVYADGLQKIEPGELGEIQLPIPPALNDAKLRYESAVQHLLGGESVRSRRIADQAMGVPTPS